MAPSGAAATALVCRQSAEKDVSPPRRRGTPRGFSGGKILGALGVLFGCHSPVDSCAQDLGGEYADGDRQWMVIDHSGSLEIYPLFHDIPQSEFEVAPRVIELKRDDRIDGMVSRRYMKGSQSCVVQTPAHLTACHDDAIEIVMADPIAPLDFEKCSTVAGSSKREVWRRVR
jgi:hypothetical protein